MPLTREQTEMIQEVVQGCMQSGQLSQTIADQINEVKNAVNTGLTAAVGTKEVVSLEQNNGGLPFYHGGVGESLDHWLKRFNRLAQANSWNADKKRDVFPWFLRGLAEQKYDSLTAAEKQNFDTMITALRDKLQHGRMSDIMSVELHARVQGEQESVADYSQEIRKLTKQAYPEFTEAMQQTFMKRAFLNGLRPDIRQFVMLSNPATFEDAEALARSQEVQNHFHFGSSPYLFKKRSKSVPSHSRVSMVHTDPGTQDDLFIDKVRNVFAAEQKQYRKEVHNLTDRLQKLETSSGNKGRSAPGNYHASRRGALRRDQGHTSASWTKDGRNCCFYCGKPGHHKAQCRKLKAR